MIQFQSSRSHQRWDWGSDCPCQLPHQLLGLIKNPQICYSAFPFLFFASLLHLHTLQFSLCLCVYLLFFQSRPPDGLFLALYCIVVTCQLLGDMCCILISLRRRLRKWEAFFVMWLSSSIFLYLMEDMIWKKDPLQLFTFAIPIRRGSHIFISNANPNQMLIMKLHIRIVPFFYNYKKSQMDIIIIETLFIYYFQSQLTIKRTCENRKERNRELRVLFLVLGEEVLASIFLSHQ